MAKDKKRIVKMVDIVPSSDAGVKHKRSKYTTHQHNERRATKNKKRVHSQESEAFFGELSELKKEPSSGSAMRGNLDASPKSKKKKIFITTITIVVIAVGVYLAMTFLPRVTITITANSAKWDFNDSIIASTHVNTISRENLTIPGEIFKQNKNVVLSFDPSSHKYIERKATGTITVVNAYSSNSQVLVATTRFKTPDGKIYRLTDRIKVPGATVSGGKLIPSSIDAKVVADKAGDAYNIGPVEKFTIPGFAGSDRYNGFYGTSKGSMTGGIVGDVPYPSDTDIAAAKEQATNAIQKQLSATIASQVPDGFTVAKGSEQSSITGIDVNTVLDKDGKFTVTSQGTESAMIFKESDVLELLRQEGLHKLELSNDFSVIDKTISYKSPSIDLKKGTMTLPVQYQATFRHNIDTDTIRGDVLGNNAIELKTYILAVAGVDKLVVTFWPFWVSHVPSNPARVNIIVE